MTPEFAAPEPPAYFDGQRLTAADLTAAQDFHRELRWLHNRALHPAGIVEGLAVDGERDGVTLIVGPGFALDGLGRELLLTEPVTVPVPPLAGAAPGEPAYLLLTLRYDADPAAELRSGVCGTEGAVRLVERPLAQWRWTGELDPEIDVVLAVVSISGCRLASPPITAGRQVVTVPSSPHVAAGNTELGATPWVSFWNAGAVAGVETTVDTSVAGFDQVPGYQARLAGLRETRYPGFANPYTVDGPVVIADPTATSFVARVILAGPSTGPFNPGAVRTSGFADHARWDLAWHVVWMGVEV